MPPNGTDDILQSNPAVRFRSSAPHQFPVGLHALGLLMGAVAGVQYPPGICGALKLRKAVRDGNDPIVLPVRRTPDLARLHVVRKGVARFHGSECEMPMLIPTTCQEQATLTCADLLRRPAQRPEPGSQEEQGSPTVQG